MLQHGPPDLLPVSAGDTFQCNPGQIQPSLGMFLFFFENRCLAFGEMGGSPSGFPAPARGSPILLRPPPRLFSSAVPAAAAVLVLPLDFAVRSTCGAKGSARTFCGENACSLRHCHVASLCSGMLRPSNLSAVANEVQLDHRSKKDIGHFISHGIFQER